MDQVLKRFLDSHDEKYWTETTRRLTYEAIRMLSRFGFGGGNYADRAVEYAVDAIGEAFSRSLKDAPSRFDLGRGDLSKTADERFWAYLVFSCLRPLITSDAEKWASRSRWPIVPLADAEDVEQPITAEAEVEAKLIVAELIRCSDDELRQLLIAAQAQFEENPTQKDINWKALQKSLGITRYACDELRKRLNKLRLAVLQSQPVLGSTQRRKS